MRAEVGAFVAECAGQSLRDFDLHEALEQFRAESLALALIPNNQRKLRFVQSAGFAQAAHAEDFGAGTFCLAFSD